MIKKDPLTILEEKQENKINPDYASILEAALAGNCILLNAELTKLQNKIGKEKLKTNLKNLPVIIVSKIWRMGRIDKKGHSYTMVRRLDLNLAACSQLNELISRTLESVDLAKLSDSQISSYKQFKVLLRSILIGGNGKTLTQNFRKFLLSENKIQKPESPVFNLLKRFDCHEPHGRDVEIIAHANGDVIRIKTDRKWRRIEPRAKAFLQGEKVSIPSFLISYDGSKTKKGFPGMCHRASTRIRKFIHSLSPSSDP